MNVRLTLLALCTASLGNTLFAQAVVLEKPFTASSKSVDAQSKGVTGSSLEVDSKLKSILAAGVPSATVKSVTLADGSTADFNLQRFSVFTTDAKVVAFDGVTETPMPRPNVVTYRGSNMADPAQHIYMGIVDGTDVYMTVSGGGKGNTVVAPASLDKGNTTHFMTAKASAEEMKSFKCDVEATPEQAELANKLSKQVNVTPKSATTLQAVYLVDAANNLYVQKGSNFNATSTYVANLFATVASVFQSDVNAVVSIGTLVVWTTADPFTGSDTNTQLTNYENYNTANRGGVLRDGAHLLKYSTGLGGRAGLTSLCPQNGPFPGANGVSNIHGNATFPVSGYHFDINIVSHEIGHNFGSIHTHCFTPPIDCCDNECPTQCPVITPTAGTIMSYCHSISGGSVSLTFHPQCVTLMRNYIETRPCITEFFANQEMAVQGNSVEIANGDATPTTTDGTDFGTVALTAGTAVRTYTIANLGNTPLNLTGLPIVSVSPSTDFTIIAQPTTPVAQLGSTTFQVQFDPTASGVRTAIVSIANNDGNENPYTFTVQGTGSNLGTPVTTSYTGPAVAIPDGTNTAAPVSIVVSGMTGQIADVNFRIDGSSCSATPGSTSVGLDHAYVGDLRLTLQSPGATVIDLMNAPSGGNMSGVNMCNTLFDDAAGSSIQTITPAGAPYTGSFQPASPLSAFNGQNPNGTWILRAYDFFTPDAGSIRAVSIIITPTGPASVSDWSLM